MLKIFSVKKKQIKYFLLVLQKSNFVFSRKQSDDPPDYNFYVRVNVEIMRSDNKGFQWESVKQKPFKAIPISPFN